MRCKLRRVRVTLSEMLSSSPKPRPSGRAMARERRLWGDRAARKQCRTGEAEAARNWSASIGLASEAVPPARKRARKPMSRLASRPTDPQHRPTRQQWHKWHRA